MPSSWERMKIITRRCWRVDSRRRAATWGDSRIVAATVLIECLAAAVSLSDSRLRRYLR